MNAIMPKILPPLPSKAIVAEAVTAISSNFPKELIQRPQWVVWKYEWRIGREKSTKVPYDAKTGRRANSTASSDWSDFTIAARAYASGPYHGLGYVFSNGDPYTGVDIDGCVDKPHGKLNPDAQKVVGLLNSYTEWSPSGMGLHIIARAEMPGGKGRNKKPYEAYDRGRYFTVTGDRLVDCAVAPEYRQSELE